MVGVSDIEWSWYVEKFSNRILKSSKVNFDVNSVWAGDHPVEYLAIFLMSKIVEKRRYNNSLIGKLWSLPKEKNTKKRKKFHFINIYELRTKNIMKCTHMKIWLRRNSFNFIWITCNYTGRGESDRLNTDKNIIFTHYVRGETKFHRWNEMYEITKLAKYKRMDKKIDR